MTSIDALLNSYEILSVHHTQHRADTKGVVIGKVEVVRMGGRTFKNTYWYVWDAPGCPLHHVDGVEIEVGRL